MDYLLASLVVGVLFVFWYLRNKNTGYSYVDIFIKSALFSMTILILDVLVVLIGIYVGVLGSLPIAALILALAVFGLFLFLESFMTTKRDFNNMKRANRDMKSMRNHDVIITAILQKRNNSNDFDEGEEYLDAYELTDTEPPS